MDPKLYLSVKEEPTESMHIKVENEVVDESLLSTGCGKAIKQERMELVIKVECENMDDTILTVKEEFCNTPVTLDKKPYVPSNSNFSERKMKFQFEEPNKTEQVLGITINSQQTESNYSHANITAVQTVKESSIPSMPTQDKSDTIATIKGSSQNNLLTNVPDGSKNSEKYSNVNNVSNNVKLGTLVKRSVKRKRNSTECNKNKVKFDTTEVNSTTKFEIKSDTNAFTSKENLNAPSLISINIRPIVDLISNDSTDIFSTEYACEITNLKSDDIVEIKANNKCNSQLECNKNKCTCNLCKIVDKKSLNIQKPEKGFVCTICKYRFRLKMQLIMHMKTHTEDVGYKPYSCHICPYVSRRKSQMYDHIRTHTGEKPFSCEICSFKTCQKGNLVRHSKIHTGEKRVVCNICQYKCTQNRTLMDHMRTHTGEKPFSCHLCDYKCSHKQSLNVHLMNHTGDKPFSCDLCGFRCTEKYKVAMHMRTHTGEKPFTCHVCGAKSARKANLIKHIKIHCKK